MPQFKADLAALKRDPGKRLPIYLYHANDQDRVRRRYIDLAACQPKNHKFEIRDLVGILVPFAILGLRIISGLRITPSVL